MFNRIDQYPVWLRLVKDELNNLFICDTVPSHHWWRKLSLFKTCNCGYSDHWALRGLTQVALKAVNIRIGYLLADVLRALDILGLGRAVSLPSLLVSGTEVEPLPRPVPLEPAPDI